MRGIVITSYLTAIFGFSSTFSLPTLTFPANWSAMRSMVGDSARHGPHHGAQKSATSKTPLVTYSFQLPSVSSITFWLAIANPREMSEPASATCGRFIRYSTQGGIPHQWARLTVEEAEPIETEGNGNRARARPAAVAAG